MSEWLYLIEVNSGQSRTRMTTSADADPMVLAIGHLFDETGWNGDFLPTDAVVENHERRVRVRYQDVEVEVRQIQHWPTHDFPERRELAAQVKAKFPVPRQIIGDKI